jgi:hypothetical protein
VRAVRFRKRRVPTIGTRPTSDSRNSSAGRVEQAAVGVAVGIALAVAAAYRRKATHHAAKLAVAVGVGVGGTVAAAVAVAVAVGIGVNVAVAVGVNEFGIAFRRSRSTCGWELASSFSRVPLIPKKLCLRRSQVVIASPRRGDPPYWELAICLAGPALRDPISALL